MVSHVFSMLMYADDTTLYCNFDNSTFEIILSNALTKLTDWLSLKKLFLNVKKNKLWFYISPKEK